MARPTRHSSHTRPEYRPCTSTRQLPERRHRRLADLMGSHETPGTKPRKYGPHVHILRVVGAASFLFPLRREIVLDPRFGPVLASINGENGCAPWITGRAE